MMTIYNSYQKITKMKFNTKPLLHRTAALTLLLTAIGGG